MAADSRTRDDSGHGYPELKLDYGLLGTKDGLSKYPYIREARRLAAVTTVVAQDIVESDHPEARARLWPDSCGIGLYPVDIHGYQEVPGAAQQTRPFQVPASALVTDYCANYIAACKNIGVTHITNGAYRLHPIEWAIGTAAGAIARLAVKAKTAPLDFIASDLLALQMDLSTAGAPIFWFDDLPPTHEAFAAAQVLAAIGLIPFDQDSLSFCPDLLISQTEVNSAIAGAQGSFGELANWSREVDALQKQLPTANRAQFAQRLFNLLGKMLQTDATRVV